MKKQRPPIEVRFDKQKGELDEIVADRASIHLERMDRNHWWLMVCKGNQSVHVNLTGRRRVTVDAVVHQEGMTIAQALVLTEQEIKKSKPVTEKGRQR